MWDMEGRDSSNSCPRRLCPLVLVLRQHQLQDSPQSPGSEAVSSVPWPVLPGLGIPSAISEAGALGLRSPYA